jgi:hypothetical protein
MTLLAGESALCESIRGIDVYFPPGAFGQNHLPLFERAVDRIADLVPADSTIAEYYCGVGSIGLALLGGARAVHFNERSPDGLLGLERGLAERALRKSVRGRRPSRALPATDSMHSMAPISYSSIHPVAASMNRYAAHSPTRRPPASSTSPADWTA